MLLSVFEREHTVQSIVAEVHNHGSHFEMYGMLEGELVASSRHDDLQAAEDAAEDFILQYD